MHFPVVLWMVVMSPTGGSPVVADVGTFGDYTECKKAAETAAFHPRQGAPASAGFICIEKPPR
jgi:hypothetical protein